jgi:S-methylmethionine-dependent homocysteine/selenocysteine methylase
MKITILDGGMGRELERNGAPFRQPEWSALALLEAPEFVTKAHEAYINAGADVISTNSYAVVPFHLGEDRFLEHGARLAALSGQIARAIAEKHSIKVAGSIPPVLGSYRPDLFEENEAKRILSVLHNGLSPFVDIWQAETLSCVAEAALIGEMLAADTRPLWLSFTLNDTLPATLRSGESIKDAVNAAIKYNAKALLFNCSIPEVMQDAVQQARSALDGKPMEIGVYANGFAPDQDDVDANAGLRELRADLDPESYLIWAKKWVSSGANIIGGCCGIGPEHIAALSAGLK